MHGCMDRGEAGQEAEEWDQDPGEEPRGEKQTDSKFDVERAPVEMSSAEVVATRGIQEGDRMVRDRVLAAAAIASGFVVAVGAENLRCQGEVEEGGMDPDLD